MGRGWILVLSWKSRIASLGLPLDLVLLGFVFGRLLIELGFSRSLVVNFSLFTGEVLVLNFFFLSFCWSEIHCNP